MCSATKFSMQKAEDKKQEEELEDVMHDFHDGSLFSDGAQTM